jgi:hypothetical protein
VYAMNEVEMLVSAVTDKVVVVDNDPVKHVSVMSKEVIIYPI